MTLEAFSIFNILKLKLQLSKNCDIDKLIALIQINN